METRAAHCLGCRERRTFIHVFQDVYDCSVCGKQRSISLDPIEVNLDGAEGRFWRSVKQTPFCWPWIAMFNGKQGPRFKLPGFSSLNVARVAYFLHYGVWPKYTAFRRCANTLCCRPDHILDLPVSKITEYRKNTGQHLTSGSKKRSFCHKGHALRGHNLVIITKGQRWPKRLCRKCRDASLHRSYMRCKERDAAGAPWNS